MNRSEGRALRLVVLGLVLGFLILPVLAGTWETLAAAFGHLPAVGAYGISIEPWRQVWALPGLQTSILLSLWTGLAATVISLVLAIGFVAGGYHRVSARAFVRLLAPLLAAPHAATAIGLGFVIAPSGWIARMFAQLPTGFDTPPDLATVNDTRGLALILGLVVKELPFFALVILAALAQLPVAQQMAAGSALGYGRGQIWAGVILPQAYALIRLPIFVVLAFSTSVVDMAIVLGPSNPPTLAVAVTRWFFAPDIGLILPASAAATLQALMVALGIGLWLVAERLVRCAGLTWLRRGARGRAAEPAIRVAGAVGGAIMLVGFLALAALVVWSLAWRWPFPAILPESWSLAGWLRPGGNWGETAATTLLIGLATTALSLTLAILWLEGEDRGRMARAKWAEALIYLPLIVPQIAFLHGLHVVFLRVGLQGDILAVIWAQSLFVFPYVMLALSEAWRALDPRLARTAASLGAGPWRRMMAVKLPCLFRPLLTAAAIGFAVSVALYLPTLFMGAGRIATLTTEAVTLSSGSDRRILGLHAVLQTLLPAFVYAMALVLPALLFRNRRALSGAPA